MALTAEEEALILRRFADTKTARRKFLQMAIRARTLSAEDKIGLITATTGVSVDVAVALTRGDTSGLVELSPQQRCKVLAILNNDDLKSVRFLERGSAAAKAVGRLVTPDGVADGSCFMISESLLLTAHHAIRDIATAMKRFVQFDYETGNAKQPTRFQLAPRQFFHTDNRPELDFTVVALGGPGDAGATRPIGFCPLPPNPSSHPCDAFVNIIQHPGKATKQVVFRNNWVICIPDVYLYYTADTNGGSSGSPVFNDHWQVVGMHRHGASLGSLGIPSGCPYPDNVGEGVPANAIVSELRAQLPLLSAEMRALLEEALGS
jgi:endonuclease G